MQSRSIWLIHHNKVSQDVSCDSCSVCLEACSFCNRSIVCPISSKVAESRARCWRGSGDDRARDDRLLMIVSCCIILLPIPIAIEPNETAKLIHAIVGSSPHCR